MFDLTQEDLHALLKRVEERHPPSRLPGHGALRIGAVALFVAGTGVYFVNGRQQTTLRGPATPTRTESQEPAARGLGGAPDPIVLQSQSLTEAQKPLLRTGPRNTLKIQASLRAIAIALGIPAERLPSSPA